MQSKKLGRAAAVAGLMALLLPGVATASWWDGGYDGRNDSGYGGRRGDESSTTTPRRDAPDYESPGETPPPADNRQPECGQSGCTKYTPPPDNNPPPQCEPSGCTKYTPPPDNNPPPQCEPSGCTKYTPPPDNNPPPQCEPSGCTKYTPPADNNPPPQCGQPECGPPPSSPPCGQPACGQGPPPPPPPPPPFFEPIYGCENSDLAGTRLSLHKTTTPPPGTPVRPGDEILVDITWSAWDWIGPDLHKALDCVYINGVFVPELSGGERPTPNDGHFGFHYFVPLDVPPGSEICDQGFVSGPSGWEEYDRAISNVVCFPVVGSTPPPPTSCCVPPPVETTTTTTMPEEEQPQPYTESVRYEQEAQPVVLPRQELPRTGSGSDAARLAAGGLALLTLIRRRTRRG